MSRYELYKFSPAPDPELICGICMNVLDVPYETVCRHVFCRDCIWIALRENPKCPVCRSPCTEDQSKEVLPLVQNLINKLTMKCDNYDNGCTELIIKEFYLDHIKSCECTLVQCRFKGCGQYLLKKDCEEHETNICMYRDQMCESGCGLMIPLESLESHNCMEALLTLVKDLKEKNLELQKEIDELKQAPSSLVKACLPVSAAGPEEDPPSSVTSGASSVSFSPQSLSSFDETEFDLSYLEYRNSLRRSSRIAALSHECGSPHDLELSDDSNQSHKNETPRNYNYSADEMADTRIADVGIVDGANVDDIITIDGENIHDRTIDGENIDDVKNIKETPEYILVSEIINSSQDSQGGSNNGCIDDSEVSTGMCSQTADDCAISSSVLGFSGNNVSSRINNESHSANDSKRPLEDYSEAYNGNSCTKKLKSQACEYKETQTEDTAFLPESSSMSNASNAELSALAKKHPHGHKKMKAESYSQTPSNSGSSFSVTGGTGSTSKQTNGIEASHKKNTFEPSFSDNANSFNSSTNARNEFNPSRHGPVTRSRRHDEDVPLEENVIPNVKVPPTVAYLLNKYAQEDDSSDDESWSPSLEN